MRSILLLVACLCCAAAFAGSDIYKWTDAQGKVHYGDKPKTGGEEVEIKGTGGNGPRLVDPDAEKAQAARDAECKSRQAKLAKYRAAPSISEQDELGHVKEYNDTERALFLERYEKKVQEVCTPQAAAK